MPRDASDKPKGFTIDYWDESEDAPPEPDDVPLLRPAIFEEAGAVEAAFTTRAGGVSGYDRSGFGSDAPFRSLNLGMSTGDLEENVRENRRRLARTMGFDPKQMAVAGQVHGSEIKAVYRRGLYKGYDGLITRTPGLLLCMTAADCASVLLADTTAGIVGACHSGWRGTVARIAEKTVTAMARGGAEPGRIRAYISPSISAEKFAVDEDVMEQFDEEFRYRRYRAKKWRVDLKAAIAAQLRQAGVLPPFIEVSPRCTCSEYETFFSYRYAQGRTGRMMGVIGLTPDAKRA